MIRDRLTGDMRLEGWGPLSRRDDVERVLFARFVLRVGVLRMGMLGIVALGVFEFGFLVFGLGGVGGDEF